MKKRDIFIIITVLIFMMLIRTPIKARVLEVIDMDYMEYLSKAGKAGRGYGEV